MIWDTAVSIRFWALTLHLMRFLISSCVEVPILRRFPFYISATRVFRAPDKLFIVIGTGQAHPVIPITCASSFSRGRDRRAGLGRGSFLRHAAVLPRMRARI